jgi:hypothetical protein
MLQLLGMPVLLAHVTFQPPSKPTIPTMLLCRYYAAASRNSGTAGVFSMAAILSSLSSSDAEGVVGAGLVEGRDGIVIINAECTILAVSKVREREGRHGAGGRGAGAGMGQGEWKGQHRAFLPAGLRKGPKACRGLCHRCAVASYPMCHVLNCHAALHHPA